MVVVVANAPLSWTEPLVRLAHSAELLIAADGGANHLARIGVRPDAVVGDLDSIRSGVRAWVGEERIVSRPDQERTDLDKALAWAVEERGARAVVVIAGTGGRPDHAVENLALLARWAGRAEVELRDDATRIVPVLAEAAFETAPGVTVSLLPVGRCERVWTEGLRWPLAGEPLDLRERTGVSNQAVDGRFSVRVEGGALLVVLPTD
jgi:thiamine pyrophosphokinase